MMVTVPDASVVLGAIRDPHGTHAGALAASTRLIAPALLDLEVGQQVRWDVINDRISARDGDRLIQRLALVPVERVLHTDLLDRAWALRNNLTMYDAAYVAVAERASATLVTSDTRLAGASGIQCPVMIV